MKDVKGYSLFKDAPSGAIRTQNRARVMINIFEDHLELQGKQARISASGMAVLMKYFSHIEQEERKDVYEVFNAYVRGSDNAIH